MPALPPVVYVELPPAPPLDGNILELSLGKLTALLTWLYEAVIMLSAGLASVNKHLEAQADLFARLDALENRKAPEAQVIVQERPRTPPPQIIQEIKLPYVPSAEERADEIRRIVRPMIDDEVAKLRAAISALTDKIQSLEDINASRHDPWARMQTYMQEIGFLPYGEPAEQDPVVLLGQIMVLIKQDIAMCPKIKELEDTKDALNARITKVESFAAEDREERSKKAAAASKKITEDLVQVDNVVQGLVRKNLADGDVAGGLRDVVIRVDTMEERRVPKLEARVRALEEAEHPEAAVAEKVKGKGFLESLAEVDVQEELRRLRTMVECMESAMPYETRQTMQFFREGEKAGSKPASPSASQQTGRPRAQTSPGGPRGGMTPDARAMTPDSRAATPGGPYESQTSFGLSRGNTMQQTGQISESIDADLAEFRMETEQQLEVHKIKADREHLNMTQNLKNHEKKVDALESKVLELWKKLPKVLAVLEPLQAQLEMFMNPEPQDGIMDSTGGPIRSREIVFEGGTGGGPGNGVATVPAGMGGAAPADLGLAGYSAAPTGPVVGGLGGPVVGGLGGPGPGQSRALGTPPGPGRPQGAQIAAGGGAAQIAAGGGAAQSRALATPTPLGQNPQSRPVTAPIPMSGGFDPMQYHTGAGGTGEGGPPVPTKGGQDSPPMAQMGGLTGLIRVALQSTTTEIHHNISNGLRQELLQFRSEFLGGLDGKANKSELQALASRLDAWVQKSSRARESRSYVARDCQPSRDGEIPADDQDADTCAPPRETTRPVTTPGKSRTEPQSPFRSPPGKKQGATCHEKCKEPTCPRSLQMSQSLSRLPALKTSIV